MDKNVSIMSLYSNDRRQSRFNVQEGVKIPPRRFCMTGIYTERIPKQIPMRHLVALLPIQ